MRRPAHRPSRRQAILDATLVELSRRPLQEVTVAEIASRAAMTPAAVYYHFPAKTELVEELVRTIGETFVALTAPPASGGSAHEQLRVVLERLLGWVAESPDEARLYFVTSPGASPAIEALRRSHLREIVSRTARLLVDAREATSLVGAHVLALALATLLAETAAAQLEEPRRRSARLDDALALAGRILSPAPSP